MPVIMVFMLAAMIAMAINQLPLPSARQLAWHKMEYYAFIHFGPNTFSGNEWGSGREDPKTFNPTALDCKQWARTFKAAGMSGIIITAKHHDGFCLWPSKYSTHTVAASPFKGDVLKQLSRACKDEGLKMGVYLSPWDRNHPQYGTPEYNEVFKNMLREVLTQYGPIFEVWFDGANGEGPNGKRQVYDWPGFIATVRKYQPMACIFSDAGPDIRWVGNESGHSAPTCWSTIDRSRYTVGTNLSAELTEGSAQGRDWVPAECDVSIRPGWFWRASENDKVKTPEKLMDLYYQSVGQNGSLLLNVPPDTRGLIHENDVASLLAFKMLRDKAFAHDLAPLAIRNGTTLTWNRALPVGMVVLEEDISQGQRIASFEINGLVKGAWRTLFSGTTIGHRRIARFPETSVQSLQVKVLSAKAEPIIQRISAFRE